MDLSGGNECFCHLLFDGWDCIAQPGHFDVVCGLQETALYAGWPLFLAKLGNVCAASREHLLDAD